MSRLDPAHRVLNQARADFEARRWTAALEGFERAGTADLEPADAERLAWSTTWAGRPAAVCLGAFERAEIAWHRVGDPRGASRAALEQARIQALVGNELVSAACWQRAHDYVAADDATVEYGMVLVVAGLGRLLEADAAAVRELATTALESPSGATDATVRTTATYLLGHAALIAGDVREGLALLDRAMSLAMVGSVQPMYAGLVYCGLLWGCREIGDWRRARQWHQVAARWCEREAIVHFPAHLSAHRAELLLAEGRLSEAEGAARAALVEAGDWHRDLIAWSHALIGEARRRQGDVDEARTEFERAAELGYDPEPGLAFLLLGAGRAETALDAVTRAIDRPHWYAFSNLIYTLPAGVAVASALPQPELAKRWSDRLDALATAYGTPRTKASALVARGALALTRGRLDEATTQLRDGVEAWRFAGEPYEEAGARLVLARARDASGDAAAARGELELAWEVFNRLGAKGEAERVRRVLRARATVRRPDEAGELTSLTPRQRQVAALVARGLSNREIAEELVVSQYTAETHVKHILVRLGFRSRAEIATWASREGLVDGVDLTAEPIDGQRLENTQAKYPASAMARPT